MLSSESYQLLEKNTISLIDSALLEFDIKDPVNIIQFCLENIDLPPEVSPVPGMLDIARNTPVLKGILEAVADPNIRKIVCQKSAQIGWTVAIIVAYICYRIVVDPANIVVMFPRRVSGQDFIVEKFEPVVLNSPSVLERLPINKKTKDNRQLHKKFPGGWVKFIGSNAPADVKSSSAPILIVEEPDDCSQNIGAGQGDSIRSIEVRATRYDDHKIFIGGTPTLEDLSHIADEMKLSDQQHYYVPCKECGAEHPLDFEHIKWDKSETVKHEVYGKYLPETARYECPHCPAQWDDEQLNDNILLGRWVATAKSNGVAGFYIWELYSLLPGSSLMSITERYLEALSRYKKGDINALIVFHNQVLGKTFKYQTDMPTAQALLDKADNYQELIVPIGGLILLMSVDVQHDRLAVIIRVWGRDEESWLVYWGELPTKVSTKNADDPVWDELDKMIYQAYETEAGYQLHLSGVVIDSGDGSTCEAVYSFVRERKNRKIDIFAIKGESKNPDKEIVTRARPIDHHSAKKTTASKFGLQVYMVGTNKAKDILANRLKLSGSGPGRFHYNSDARSDYFEQLVSENKAPARGVLNKLIWQKKPGEPNEAWDCETYNIYLFRLLRLHLKKPEYWDNLELQLKQAELFSVEQTPASVNNKRADQWVQEETEQWI